MTSCRGLIAYRLDRPSQHACLIVVCSSVDFATHALPKILTQVNAEPACHVIKEHAKFTRPPRETPAGPNAVRCDKAAASRGDLHHWWCLSAITNSAIQRMENTDRTLNTSRGRGKSRNRSARRTTRPHPATPYLARLTVHVGRKQRRASSRSTARDASAPRRSAQFRTAGAPDAPGANIRGQPAGVTNFGLWAWVLVGSGTAPNSDLRDRCRQGVRELQSGRSTGHAGRARGVGRGRRR